MKTLFHSLPALLWLFVGYGDQAVAQPIVWVVPNSLQRVLPTDAAGSGTTASIFAVLGEYESFQVAIQGPSGGLTNVNFAVSDLTGPGGATISKSNLTLYRENYITITTHSPTWNGPPNLPLTTNTFPDALIPFLDPATGQPPVAATYQAVPFTVSSGNNAVIWIDVFVPRTASAGLYTGTYTVTSAQGSVQGQIQVNVWNFALPLNPSLKTNVNPGGTTVTGVNEELLRNKLSPSNVPTAKERTFIDQFGLNATDTGFFSGASYGHCGMTAAPTVQALQNAKATHQADLFLYNYTGDPESGCTTSTFYNNVISWAKNLHRAGIPNFMTQQPVPALYNDGLGTGRSAVDIWAMLPFDYDAAQSFSPPRVDYVIGKGDSAWSYNDLVVDSYSPKWELDFPPINYRIQPGFINQNLSLTGLLYWSVDDWPTNPWTNIQSAQFPGYPGEGILVYPGAPAGLQGVAPSMRLKYLRDGVEDYEFIQILKNCGQQAWALSTSQMVATNWSNWTSDENLLESVRRLLGNRIVAFCSGGDTTPPVVSMTAPTSGTLVRGTITLSANASDNVGVAGVQFLVDGANTGAEDTTSPYSISFNTSTLTNGSHTFSARSRDAAGNTATATAVTVTVDNVPPTVSMTAPANGATVSGSITLSATASDNLAVAGVQFLVDGTNTGAEDTTSPYSISFNTSTLTNGSHSFSARARDTAGNTTTSTTITVTVSNTTDTTPPIVSMTAPADSSTVTGTITLSANASDNIGVVGVQFLVDGANTGAEDTTSPYSISFNTSTLTPGYWYQFSARARDAAGNTTTSTPVSVLVQ